ncbi:MAG: hypothetical protein SPK03_01580, partial [Alloprevotella sp.]|nr:hypothetical protein [Alloprevotella sp.]
GSLPFYKIGCTSAEQMKIRPQGVALGWGLKKGLSALCIERRNIYPLSRANENPSPRRCLGLGAKERTFSPLH